MSCFGFITPRASYVGITVLEGYWPGWFIAEVQGLLPAVLWLCTWAIWLCLTLVDSWCLGGDIDSLMRPHWPICPFKCAVAVPCIQPAFTFFGLQLFMSVDSAVRLSQRFQDMARLNFLVLLGVYVHAWLHLCMKHAWLHACVHAGMCHYV